MTGTHYLGVEFRQAANRFPVLGGIQQETAPAQLEVWPGDDGIADEQGLFFRPPEGQMTRAVSRRMHHCQRADLVPFVDEMIRHSWPMFADI